MESPKAFISYSWTSPAFQNQIRLWAERLAADGVEILLDQFDLKEGQDKYSYMERMVTDVKVTHVLMFSDKRYSEKANKREAGVGTESQIISKEIYEKVDQSKFVPIVCEFDEKGQPCLPVFAASRIWLDFSTEESVNKNWERLVRHLFGKPLYEKPQTGKPPAYISEGSAAPSNPAAGKFAVFKNAFHAGQKGTRAYRLDFLDACASYVDELRPRARVDIPQAEIPQWIIDGFRKLIPARNLIVDWVLLEGGADEQSRDFEDALLGFLEKLIELRERPESVSSWSDFWYEPHQLFAYDTFLHVVAALIKVGAYKTLNAVLMGTYMLPSQSTRSGKFTTITVFYEHTESINSALTTENARYHSQAMELIKRNVERTDIPFSAIKEADALCHLATFVGGGDEWWWYPQSHYYWSYGSVPQFFVRATQRRNFAKLATVLGIATGDEVRKRYAERKEKDGRRGSFENLVNLDKLDTLS